MSSEYIGIEEGRKRLGDLVTAVQQGADIVLTRNGKPAARIVAIKEPVMTTTTTSRFGGKFGRDEQMQGIYAYINNGEYGDEEGAVAEALLDALQDEVDERLPEGCRWLPSTSEFLHGVDVDMPDHEDVGVLFYDAWAAVEARFAEIESKALAG